MSILLPKITERYGVLATEGVLDGTGPSAAELREIARNANRLLVKSAPVWRSNWRSANVAGESMTYNDLVGWGQPGWIQLTPRKPVRKKPFANKYHVFTEFWVTAGSRHYLQIETSLHPFDPAARTGSPNVVTIDGDVADDTWVQDSVHTLTAPVGIEDYYALWLYSESFDALMDEGTYGAPNTGTIDAVNPAPASGGAGSITSGGASWNTSGTTPASGGHVIHIEDSSGGILIGPRVITFNTGNTLTFRPGPSLGAGASNAYALIGQTFKINKASLWRPGDVCAYTQARSV